MKQKIQTIFTPRYLIAILCFGVVAVLLIILLCSAIILHDKQFVLPANTTKHIRVGMVLGAGITKDGKPYKELEARLDTGAEALRRGQVDKLILSGDNRFKDYDEPSAMKEYLVREQGIAPEKLQPDFAGRSTYESCERAAKIFGQKKLIIFSAGSHLPRAIYLCRHFGIESYGIASDKEANNAQRREVQARVKAIYNVYFKGEPTVLGQPIRL